MGFFKNLSDTMRERREVQNRETALIFGGCAVVFAIVAVIGVVVAGIFNAVESSAVNSAFGEIIANACDPVPTGADSKDDIPAAETPRGVLLLTAESQRRHAWHSDLAPAYQAESGDETDLVGCVNLDWVELEQCDYSRADPEGGTFTVNITREQHTVEIVLVAPQPDRIARRVASQTLTGSEPAPCPDEYPDGASRRERGDQLTWADFAPWAEEVIFAD